MRRSLDTRYLLVAAALAAAALGVGAAAVLGPRPPPALRAGTVLETPRPLADFSLTDQGSRPLGARDLEGRWTLLFTGFTHCPDLCPTTLAQLADVRSRVPGPQLQVLFLSVDPERDTPERIAGYLAHFGQGIRGATGTAAQVEAFTRQLGLAQVRNPGADGDYTVDHSTALVLIDPQARVAAYFRPPHDAAAIAADLAQLPRGAD